MQMSGKIMRSSTVPQGEAGTLGRLSAGSSGSAGDLGYQEGAQRLEKDERPLSQKRKRWWGVGVL